MFEQVKKINYDSTAVVYEIQTHARTHVLGCAGIRRPPFAVVGSECFLLAAPAFITQYRHSLFLGGQRYGGDARGGGYIDS